MSDAFAAAVEAAPGPTDKDLRRVTDLARVQLDLEKEIEVTEKKLADLQAKLKRNREVDLPLAMDEAGAAGFTLSNGAKIEVKPIVQASITEDHRPEAHAWLETHKHGAMIKRQIQILFGRNEMAWARKFLADCQKRKLKLNLKTKEWVEPQTLKAFVREQRRLAMEQGANPDEAVPMELFGIYVARAAEVHLPKDN